MSYRIGLIVNPIAGMGGAVGLKGTDGERLAAALARGARPLAGRRATTALAALARSGHAIELLTCGGDMGERAARAAGLAPRILYRARTEQSAREDTLAAARELLAAGPDLLLFAGGDGTARDVLAAVGDRVPVLGIPAGVKMHSAVFAPGPTAAGDVAAAFLDASCAASRLQDAEVMDRDIDRDGAASPELHGTLRVPVSSLWSPQPKAGGGDDARLDGACAWAAALAGDDRITLLGPGATMMRIKRRLGIDGTLLGVDAVRRGALLAADLGERQILELLSEAQGRLVLSVVGGQGFLFGRGNQPFSPAVIRRVGRENIVIVAALAKLTALAGRPLLVDTGDPALDRDLEGFLPVRVGAKRTVQYRIAAAATPARGPVPPAKRRRQSA